MFIRNAARSAVTPERAERDADSNAATSAATPISSYSQRAHIGYPSADSDAATCHASIRYFAGLTCFQVRPWMMSEIVHLSTPNSLANADPLSTPPLNLYLRLISAT